MGTTLGDVMQGVEDRLSLAGGIDAQTYVEPRLIKAIQFRFNTLFRQFWLPEYTTWQEPYTLGVNTGLVTGDLSGKILDWRDLHSVFFDRYDQPLAFAPTNVQQQNITQISLVWYLTNPQKVFKVLPVTTSGTLLVSYRTHPGKFEKEDDVIKLDQDLLELGVCFDLLNDDSINPGNADKFERFYNEALKEFTKNVHNQTRSLLPATIGYPTRWR